MAITLFNSQTTTSGGSTTSKTSNDVFKVSATLVDTKMIKGV